jgi:DNA-directed RNA polymerase subunit RPC12/RpoP
MLNQEIDMNKINFKCPTCGGARIEEVLEGVVKFSEITGVAIDADGDLALEYGNTNDEGGELDRYQCVDCGAPVSVDVLVEIARTVTPETEGD